MSKAHVIFASMRKRESSIRVTEFWRNVDRVQAADLSEIPADTPLLYPGLSPGADGGPGDAPCWPWTGALDKEGYPAFHARLRGRSARYSARRVLWALLFGDVPSDPNIRFIALCGSKICMRPGHLAVFRQGVRTKEEKQEKRRAQDAKRRRAKSEQARKDAFVGIVDDTELLEICFYSAPTQYALGKKLKLHHRSVTRRLTRAIQAGWVTLSPDGKVQFLDDVFVVPWSVRKVRRY